MNRESALLGTPTYTIFAGRLGAVDEALIEAGLLSDLREPTASPAFVKKTPSPATHSLDGHTILTTILDTLGRAA